MKRGLVWEDMWCSRCCALYMNANPGDQCKKCKKGVVVVIDRIPSAPLLTYEEVKRIRILIACLNFFRDELMAPVCFLLTILIMSGLVKFLFWVVGCFDF